MGLNITKLDTNKYLLDIRIKRAGKEIRKRKVFYGSKSKAEDEYFELRKSLKTGGTINPLSRIETFGDALKVYMDRRESMSPSDLGRCKTLLNDLGEVPIYTIADKFEEYLKILRTYPSHRTGKLLAPATVNRIQEFVKATMSLVFELELIEKNPITKRRFPKFKEIPRDKYLNPQQVIVLLNILKREAPHLELITRFALQVPCRKSELVNMKKDDLDLINQAIRIKNGTTKNDQGLWKPIPPDLFEYFCNLPKESKYLFYRIVDGEYKHLGDFKKSWNRCTKLAGISDLRFHDTRHISATNLLDNGTPEQVVMEVAGWKTNMLKTYYHRSGKKSLELVKFNYEPSELYLNYSVSKEH